MHAFTFMGLKEQWSERILDILYRSMCLLWSRKDRTKL